MLLLAVTSLASCSSDEVEPGNSGPVEKQRIKLGVLPVLGAAPVFMANEAGFFREEGLDVEFVTIQGAGAAVPAMANGDLDLVFGNYVSFFAAQANATVSVKFVADGYSPGQGRGWSWSPRIRRCANQPTSPANASA